MTHASAEINTMYGTASSAWKIEGDNLKLTVTIPVNTSGSIVVDTDSFRDVKINGQLLKEQTGVNISEEENKILVGSGSYTIEYKLSK